MLLGAMTNVALSLQDMNATRPPGPFEGLAMACSRSVRMDGPTPQACALHVVGHGRPNRPPGYSSEETIHVVGAFPHHKTRGER